MTGLVFALKVWSTLVLVGPGPRPAYIVVPAACHHSPLACYP